MLQRALPIRPPTCDNDSFGAARQRGRPVLPRAVPAGPCSGEVSRINAQRNQRFVRLFAQHEHQVYAYIVSVLANWTDADEVMQETSVALWDLFDEFEEGTSFRSWACRIAYFRILRFREQRRRDRHEYDQQFVDAVAETAEEEAEMFEFRRKALGDCVGRLPPRDRELLQSCYADGGTIKSAAEQLARPAKSVYKALARIRKVLFECVQRKATAEEAGR